MRYRGHKTDILAWILCIVGLVSLLIPSPIRKEIIVQEKTIYQPIVIEQETTVLKPTTYVTISNDNQFPGLYPTAEKIWVELKEYGLNDYVCAGIIGNIMAEIGGNTLVLDHWEYWSKNDSYGICQWKDGRRLQLLNEFGSDIDAQIEFLLYELPIEMDKFGYLYETDYNYEAFVSSLSLEETAVAFAKCFERCQNKYVEMRISNAQMAYEYFVGSVAE